jgi:hypothetical protein
MRQHSLTARERLAVTLGGASVLVVLLGARIGPTLLKWRSDEVTLAVSVQEELAHATASIRRLPAVRESVIVRRVRLAMADSAVLDGDNPAVAGAALAELLSDAADDADVELGSVQVESDTSSIAPLYTVRARASGVASVESIVTLLSALERGKPLVAVRELTLTQQQAGTSLSEELRAELLVEAVARNRGRIR